MNNPIASAIKQICDDKNIPQDQVIEALEAALAAAYRKDFAEKNQNIKCEFDIKTGNSRFFDVKKVVEDLPPEEDAPQGKGKSDEPQQTPSKEETGSPSEESEKRKFNPKTEITLSEARQTYPDIQLDEDIRTELSIPAEFGRMAAQTAKQVIIQKIREAERGTLYQGFKDKEGSLMIGTIQRREEQRVLVDFGKVTAILPASEHVPRERYNPGERIKVYVMSVEMSTKGPEIIVSRTHPLFVKKIFEAEIPEVANGAIEIKAISREAGQRSKVAVFSHNENIDPIGSCIGQRGNRIQTIIAELGGEKVDIIQYDEDTQLFIAHALKPAEIAHITLHEETKTAVVAVQEDQLSLAIGKMGQNVRLASQLTGWNIEVVSQAGTNKKSAQEKDPEEHSAEEQKEKTSKEVSAEE
ncbi:transcription termination/antitermination protein NusA [Candidatus Uhrbacteria bacterium]|nr:transcription termination/antitermination protein NusA [Candidatus Uhrbacteria bacterium]